MLFPRLQGAEAESEQLGLGCNKSKAASLQMMVFLSFQIPHYSLGPNSELCLTGFWSKCPRCRHSQLLCDVVNRDSHTLLSLFSGVI